MKIFPTDSIEAIFRFLALRGSSVYIFDSPPLTAGDWPDDDTENDDDHKTSAGVMEYKVRKGMR